MANFVQSVLEQPLIAHHVASLLDHRDIIHFACLSKDERFVEAVSGFVEGARFVLDLETFFSLWDNADDEFSETLDHLTDMHTFDTVLKEREVYFTDRCIELCDFLKRNWALVETSSAFKKSIQRKMTEMGETFPSFRSYCDEFIGAMFPQEG